MYLEYNDVGQFSYVAGLLGAAIFLALEIGPGWLGFFIVYIPASILASWTQQCN